MRARFTSTVVASLAFTGCSAAFAPSYSDSSVIASGASASLDSVTSSTSALNLRPSQADQLAKAASHCYFSDWKDRQAMDARNEKEMGKKALLADHDSVSKDCTDRTFKWFNVAPSLYNMAFLQRQKKH
eukprot:CAMPEP_0196810818 /NCGR_PEP_ID=MMETSP1362-20130617/14364_1 /TAXON_ID=163516 /ORGANISM="Leptocylindrus danicus, Strain CCMP1856" /LENGTH=128 /DNA_ID=CAMNT_0042185971 /DNA_START=87 /DNA_END=473 /DNA_ORIENTATION=+